MSLADTLGTHEQQTEWRSGGIFFNELFRCDLSQLNGLSCEIQNLEVLKLTVHVSRWNFGILYQPLHSGFSEAIATNDTRNAVFGDLDPACAATLGTTGERSRGDVPLHEGHFTSVQIPEQLFRPLRAPQFSKRSLFDLTNSFARQFQIGANFGESLGLQVAEPEPPLDDQLFFVIKLA